jgi:hypothetical protein
LFAFFFLRYNTRLINADSTSENDEIRLYFDRQVVLKMVIRTSVFMLEVLMRGGYVHSICFNIEKKFVITFIWDL